VSEVELLEELEKVLIGFLQGVESPRSGLLPAPVKRSPAPFGRAGQQVDRAIVRVVNKTDGFGAGDCLLNGTSRHKLSAIRGGIAVVRRTMGAGFENQVAPILLS
jgi:hypothetical protein